MKKILYTLLAITIIFSACEKEEDSSSNNNSNNNSDLLLEQTIWKLQSYNLFNTTTSIPNTNDPFWGDTGLSDVTWLFFNNNEWLIQEYIGNNGVIMRDTSNYSFYSEIDIITLDYNEYINDGIALTNIGQEDITSLNIISFSNNNLICEGTWVDDGGDINHTIRFSLIKQ